MKKIHFERIRWKYRIRNFSNFISFYPPHQFFFYFVVPCFINVYFNKVLSTTKIIINLVSEVWEKCKPMLMGVTDWFVATDLEQHLNFSAEITLTIQCPDIVIWIVKLFWGGGRWLLRKTLIGDMKENKKYEKFHEQYERQDNVFPVEMRCWSFVTNLILVYQSRLRLPCRERGSSKTR